MLALIAGVVLLGAVSALAGTAEDARMEAALRRDDVYASPSVMGDLAEVSEERMRVRVDELEQRGQDVKMALVPDLRGEEVFAYAARIRGELAYGGTLVVTTRDGPVGAAGPRSERSIRGAFRARAVDGVPVATQRLIRAAELAVPPPEGRHAAGRELLVLIGLTLMGGAWAIGWGLRREQRRAKARVAERRARLRVVFDALAAQTDIVRATPHLPPDASAMLDRAAEHGERGVAAAGLGRSTDMDDADAHLRDGVAQLLAAGERVGWRQPGVSIYAGLCAVDPAHGAATSLARVPWRSTPAPVCGACRAAVDGGQPPARRLVPVEGRPVPFDEVEPAAPRGRDAAAGGQRA